MPESDPSEERDSQCDHRILPGFSDAQLVERLRADGCTGPLWDLACAELAGRGLRSIYRMIHTGTLDSTIATLLSKAQPGRRFKRYPNDDADATAWVGEAVARGLNRFRRDTLAGRGWAADDHVGREHAALGTWVINAMLLQIPDILRTERTRTDRHLREVPCPPEVVQREQEDRHSGFGDPEELTISAETLARLNAVLKTMRPDARSVIQRQLTTGRSRAECCRDLGHNLRAIEEYLRRWRRKHRDPGGHHD